MDALSTLEPPVADDPRLRERLVDAVDRARDAARDEAVDGRAVGAHLGVVVEDGAVTHRFAATRPDYRGWYWAVTLAAVADGPVTVSEVVLQPGGDALVAPVWVPWEQRIRPGDLGVGDRLPTAPDDPRLVPGYAGDADPAGADLPGAVDLADAGGLVREVGLGRERVLSRDGRERAAQRWWDGPHGPASDMARAAPAPCSTCGFLLPVGGALRGAFGVCANEYAPADGTVVALAFGCGAHSDVTPEAPAPAPEPVYDDGVDLEPVGS